jgi:hypothetical protein
MVMRIFPIATPTKLQYAPKTGRREPQTCDSLPLDQLASEQILKFNPIQSIRPIQPIAPIPIDYRVPEPWVITGGAVGSGTNLATKVFDPGAVAADRGETDA